MADPVPSSSPQPPNRPDRASLYLLSAIAVIVLIGGVLQFRQYLRSTEKNLNEQYATAVADGINQALVNSNESLQILEDQSLDDDTDGLSNFDELYVTGTSPYLADSDSDGIDDDVELAANTNPNCPTGEVCDTVPTPGDGTTTAAEDGLTELAPTIAGEDLTREQLIEKLSAQGIPVESLNQATDAELEAVYREFLATSQPGNNTAATIQDQADSIRAMSLADKRALLIDSGIEQSTVEALNDDEVSQFIETAIVQILEESALPTAADDAPASDNTNAAPASDVEPDTTNSL